MHLLGAVRERQLKHLYLRAGGESLAEEQQLVIGWLCHMASCLTARLHDPAWDQLGPLHVVRALKGKVAKVKEQVANMHQNISFRVELQARLCIND